MSILQLFGPRSKPRAMFSKLEPLFDFCFSWIETVGNFQSRVMQVRCIEVPSGNLWSGLLWSPETLKILAAFPTRPQLQSWLLHIYGQMLKWRSLFGILPFLRITLHATKQVFWSLCPVQPSSLVPSSKPQVEAGCVESHDIFDNFLLLPFLRTPVRVAGVPE